jgi:DNA-directed RNA polymerase subunit H (RpoH/RPB5)
MTKYKISKSNLKEFFGLFGKKKPQTLQSIIDADPVLQKLDNEMGDIVKSFAPRVRKIADEQPELFQKWVKLGIIDKDFK